MKITNRWARCTVASFPLAALLAWPQTVHAEVSACGNFNVDASAMCSVVTQKDCTTTCEPASCEQACAAKLEQTCNSQCTTSADATCVSTCNSDCTTSCATSPPKFDCTTDCNTRCEAGCSAGCSSSSSSSSGPDGSVEESSTDCQASCGACCDDHCTTTCVSVPTTATCETKCNADCTGSCTATANTNCQEQCQESSFETCKAQLASSCTTQCQTTGGAIVCDGQYVDTSNVEQCVTALNAVLTTQISATVTATGTSSCDGGECSGQGSVTSKVSCAAAPGTGSNGFFWAFGVGMVGVIAGARRRAKR